MLLVDRVASGHENLRAFARGPDTVWCHVHPIRLIPIYVRQDEQLRQGKARPDVEVFLWIGVVPPPASDLAAVLRGFFEMTRSRLNLSTDVQAEVEHTSIPCHEHEIGANVELARVERRPVQCRKRFFDRFNPENPGPLSVGTPHSHSQAHSSDAPK